MAQNAPAQVAAPQGRRQAIEELTKVVDSAQEVLSRTRTVFPLDLFPDTIIVDRTQVSISHRAFFFVGNLTSIRIEDILNVTAQVGPFFGSLRISTRFFDPDKPHVITKLWRDDALRLHAIIQGLVVASQKEIDTAAFDRRELVEGLTRVGQSSPQDNP